MCAIEYIAVVSGFIFASSPGGIFLSGETHAPIPKVSTWLSWCD